MMSSHNNDGIVFLISVVMVLISIYLSIHRECIEIDDQIVYRASCNESVSAFLQSNLIIVGGVGIAFGLFEV